MDDRSRQQRADDAAAGLRRFSSEEVSRMGMVLLPAALLSLVLQCLLLVVGVRTARQMYRVRHLGMRPVLRVAASHSLLGLSALNLVYLVVTNRWLSGWVGRVNATPTD